MGCLYKLTSPSGKSYIGITSKRFEARWAKHLEHAAGKRTAGALYAALRKYGPESFTHEVLTTSASWNELCELERATIQRLGTLAPNGYNITTGGEGVLGPRSDIAKAHISVAQKKRFERPDQRAAMAEYGRRANAKTAEAANARRIQRKADRAIHMSSDAYKAMRSRRVKDALARPEIRAKVIACAQARPADPEWRRKIGDSKRGKTTGPCSDRRRQLISEARRREWADPVIRERRLAALAVARSYRTKKVA